MKNRTFDRKQDEKLKTSSFPEVRSFLLLNEQVVEVLDEGVQLIDRVDLRAGGLLMFAANRRSAPTAI